MRGAVGAHASAKSHALLIERGVIWGTAGPRLRLPLTRLRHPLPVSRGEGDFGQDYCNCFRTNASTVFV